MSNELTPRDERIAKWWFKDMLGHTGEMPRGNFALVYMMSLLDIAAADGVLEKKERDWVLGFASSVGLEEDTIQKLHAYQPGSSQDAMNSFNDADKPYIESARLGLLFYGFRAASADGELHPKELEAIYSIGKKLGVTDEQIKVIQALSDEEDRMREKRASTLYPKGLDESMIEYDKKFS